MTESMGFQPDHAEIRARHRLWLHVQVILAGKHIFALNGPDAEQAVADIGILLAENEALQCEVDRLTDEVLDLGYQLMGDDL